jgi:hypothetical protein
VTVNVAGPDNETVKSAEADPPEFVSVKVCDCESPTPTVPKSKLPAVAGDQLIDGGPPALPTAADVNNANTAAATVTVTLRNKRTIPPPSGSNVSPTRLHRHQ